MHLPCQPRYIGWAITMLIAISSDKALSGPRSRAKRTAPPAPTVAKGDVKEGIVTISYPDSVKLGSFIDYVSQSLGLTIVYGEEVKNQTVVFRPSTVQVPRDQILVLLKSMLRMRDLALVESDVAGWMRVVPADDLQRHVSSLRTDPLSESVGKENAVITQVIPVASSDVGRVVKYLRSFLSSPKASIVEIPEQKLLVLTDYESSVRRAMDIVKLVDVVPDQAQIQSLQVRHGKGDELAKRISTILDSKAKIEQQSAPKATIEVAPDGGLLVIGPLAAIAEVTELLARFDVPESNEIVATTYAPRSVTVDRLQSVVEQVFLSDFKDAPGVKLFADKDANRLYVTAPKDVHHKIDAFLQEEDSSSSEAARPLRIYRPRNRQARYLLATLSQVLPNISESVVQQGAAQEISTDAQSPPGPNRPPAPPGEEAPPPPALRTGQTNTVRPVPEVKRVTGPDFILSVDAHTNSLIAIGPREFHARLENLLRELDKRQPQVVIEMTLVAITFNDSLGLAIELANEEKWSDYQSLLFSSFGLSNINLATGRRQFSPGGGFNGVIMGPNETPILMRAIAAHGNSRVITTPKIVVADGTTATISSLDEAPFTSINASNTVATTSFAGFESAGTTLTVTPHEAQEGFVGMDYSFNFSNFTGSGSVSVPPPRTTNSFSGTIEVPDGHTVIVGGLVTENEADSVTEVPLLGRIPGLGMLFQNSDRARTKSRIFAFIRPTILRDDEFADLKLISQNERQQAGLDGDDFPKSDYQWMR